MKLFAGPIQIFVSDIVKAKFLDSSVSEFNLIEIK